MRAGGSSPTLAGPAFCNKSNKSGFTLIEAVLSIALLGVGLVGIIFAFQGAASSSLLADQTVVATNIARDTLERIVQQRNVSGYAATRTSIDGGTYNANPVAGFTGYVLTTTESEVNPDDDSATDDFLNAQAASGYARVTTVVSWNSAANSIRLVTLIVNYP